MSQTDQSMTQIECAWIIVELDKVIIKNELYCHRHEIIIISDNDTKNTIICTDINNNQIN